MKRSCCGKVIMCTLIAASMLFTYGCEKKEENIVVEATEPTIAPAEKSVVETEMANEEPLNEHEEKTNMLTLEDAEAFIEQADNAVRDIMKDLEKEETINKEDIYAQLEDYFDKSIIDYVLFSNQILEKDGKYTYKPYAEFKLFWMDVAGDMSILSQNDESYEIGVLFRHTWKTKQEEEIVPVRIECKEDKWKITDISQWYNDFLYYHMPDEVFEPEYFTKERAETLVENFGIDKEGKRVPIIAEVGNNGYILEDSSKHLFSEEEINGLSRYELYLAVQEIYARHGKKFEDPVLYQHFSRLNWYTPYDSTFSEETLSEIETENIKVLAEKGDFTEEINPDYGSLYPTSDNQSGKITEEEISCIIYHAFDMADGVITCKEENIIEEKSQDVIQYYSLGEYSDEESLKGYLANWFDEEMFDYLVMMYNTWTGLDKDENGQFYVSQEGTYAGESYKPYFAQKVTFKEQDENKIVAEVAFYNYILPEISTGEMILKKRADEWVITSISWPYYDEICAETGQAAYYDVNADGHDELIIKTEKELYVLVEKEEAFNVAYSGTYSVLLENGMIQYYRPGGAPLHEDYTYYLFEANEYKEEASLSRYDGNENGEYDEQDDYFYNEAPVSMSEWNIILQKYQEYGEAELDYDTKEKL